jgi:hypothetical protein
VTSVRETAVQAFGPAEAGIRTRSGQLARSVSRAIPAIGLAAGAVFVASQLNHGWVPLDEGTLAQSAQRVLAGELPHRDFAELYTGGLSFMNAGVLWLTGGNLFWLRVPMFLLFLVYMPCVYFIARRFASQSVATLAVLFAVAWGPPVYPSAMPSWYALYLAVIGAYLLIRHHETGRSKWLFWAGVMGGLSLCCKITGLWYVLAVAVYLVYRVQNRVRPRAGRTSAQAIRISRRAVFVAVPLIAVVTVAGVLAAKLGAPELFNFLVPVAAVCGLTLWRELRAGPDDDRTALRLLLRDAAPFAAGAALPVLLLIAPYLATGSQGDLTTGVFVTPRGRLSGEGYYPSPQPVSLAFAAPIVVLLFVVRSRARAARSVEIAAITTLAALLLLSTTVSGYVTLWYATTTLLPVGVMLGVVLLARPSAAGLGRDGSPLYLLLALSAFVALVQFPFAAPVYFSFVAPLAVLAWLAMFRHPALHGAVNRVFPVAVLAAIVAFGFVVNHGVLYRDGLRLRPNPQTVILDPKVAWIRVSPTDRFVYSRTSALIAAHARGSYIFAGPDTPEIYALTGRRNPTRSLFDYLDPSNSARGENLERTLRAHGVTTIVINSRPAFSKRLDARTVSRLRHAYPRHARVGLFDVRWKN